MKNNYYASGSSGSSAYGAGYGPGAEAGYLPGEPAGQSGQVIQHTNQVGGGMDFDIVRLLKRLYRHWFILVLLWLVFASIKLSTEAKKGLVFQSYGKLSLGDDSGRNLPLASMMGGGTGVSNLYTQQLILRSDDLACEVIRENGINAFLSAPNPQVAGKIAYRPEFWQWEWANQAGNARIENYASGLTVRHSNTNENMYSMVSYTIEFVDNERFEVKNGNKMQVATGRLRELVRTPEARFALEASGTCVMAKGDVVNISIGPDFAYAGMFLGGLSVQPMGNMQQTSNLIQIGYTTNSPFVAQQVVESVMDIYLKRTLKEATYSSQKTYAFVTELMGNVQGRLAAQTKLLQDEQKRIGSFTLDPIVEKQIADVAKAEARLNQIKDILPRLQAIGAAVKAADPLQGDDRRLIELAGLADAPVRAAIEDYRAAQRSFHQYERTFTDGHARVVQSRAEVAQAWGALGAIVQAQAVELETERGRTEQELVKNQDAFNALPESQRRLAELQRNVAVLQANYDSLLAEQTRADIARETTVSSYSIKDHARPALGPSAPTLSQAISSSVGLAFILAALLVMLPGLRIRWFETAEEAMKVIHYPVFGVLPSTGQRSRRGERKILVQDPNGRWAEAMRLLRTNLLQAMAGKTSQVIMVSGAQPGDGKSTVAANLAASLAQSSRIKSVLLIDADMHRPSLHGVFGVPQSPGLSDYLNGTATIEQVVYQVEIPGAEGRTLSFISAGPIPPVPSDLVETEAMQALFAYAREKHAFTVLDTPPYPLVSVAGTLAEYVDRVLTVCRIGRTARGLYQRHVAHLARHGANIGQIFNSPSAGRIGSAQDSYGYGDDYGYGYGYGYGKYGYGYGAKEKQDAEVAKKDASSAS